MDVELTNIKTEGSFRHTYIQENSHNKNV